MARLDRQTAWAGARSCAGRRGDWARLFIRAALLPGRTGGRTAANGRSERLAEADILLVQGLPPESNYRFKHALIQDAAYENLLKSRRQILHRRVGEVLRDQLAAGADTEPELLAHHFKQAGLIEAAIEW